MGWKWEYREWIRKGGEEMKGGKVGDPWVGSHPHVRNPEKYFDCKTDLIGGGGNTDVCPGRQIPSRRQ